MLALWALLVIDVLDFTGTLILFSSLRCGSRCGHLDVLDFTLILFGRSSLWFPLCACSVAT